MVETKEKLVVEEAHLVVILLNLKTGWKVENILKNTDLKNDIMLTSWCLAGTMFTIILILHANIC